MTRGRMARAVGDALADAPVRPGGVVVLLVFGQNGSQVRLAEGHQAAINKFAPQGAARRSQIAFIRGACTAVRRDHGWLGGLPGLSPYVRAAPNPRALTRRFGASSLLGFSLRALLRLPVVASGSSPSSAFLWFPSAGVLGSFPSAVTVRFRSPSVSLRVPFPSRHPEASTAAGRFRGVGPVGKD